MAHAKPKAHPQESTIREILPRQDRANIARLTFGPYVDRSGKQEKAEVN